jgi:ABC-2 type transport system ATP-binding protein
MSLHLDTVSKYYGSQAAVDDVSFQASSGQIIGLLGPNGAGKSTTMKMICGYVSPDSGSVSILGQETSNTQTDIRKHIGYLPESNPLYEDMYVKEFLRFACRVHKLDKWRSRVEKVIEMTGLHLEQHKLINQLSKGYRQRVGIAQAILHDPEILILDEPISGLDPNQLVEIRSLIKTLGEEKTVIFSSHILQEVEQICDRLLVLNHGRLVMDGSVAEFYKTTSGKAQVFVRFDQAIDPNSVLINDDELIKESSSSFAILSKNPDRIKKDLFDYAVGKSVRITELTEKASSVEDVFKELTAKSE